MEKENSSKKFIKRFLISILAVAVLIAGTVIFFDPFYHYHKPWCGLKAVLNDKEYQCVGTLRNFDYNALLVGSSVMENNNNVWYDDAYGVKSIKAIRSYGATADLCYLLDVAYEKHDLEYVFYNIDPSSLVADAQTTFEAALDLGATPLQAFFRVVLPDIMPGITSGFMLAFTMSLDDFIITHFTKGAGIDTISTLVYSQVRKGISPAMYALSTIIFLTVFIVLLIGNYAPRYFQRKKAAA